MSEDAKARKAREDAEWERDEAERAAAKSNREAQRQAQAARIARLEAEREREEKESAVDELEERIEELEAELKAVAAKGADAHAGLLRCFSARAELMRVVRRAMSHLTHGEATTALDVLRDFADRHECDPPEQLAVPGSVGVIDVRGRGVQSAVVSTKIMSDCLTVRIDDEARPEFWCEVHLREEQLLLLLAQVHRLTHSRAAGPDDSDGR